MLSILIPTYDYNSFSLVEELHQQCIDCIIKYEILVYDDGSKSPINTYNNEINLIKNCVFKELPNNMGRSAIRNLLAKDAKFRNLLFIDAGTFPKNSNFVKTYLLHMDKMVVNGGMKHKRPTPNKPYKLRWLLTKKRESKALCSSNFLIKKTVFNRHPFDESIVKYGYEDVVFFKNLIKNRIEITRIKNEVVHDGKDAANIFIKKTEFAIQNLVTLVEKEVLDKKDSRIYTYYLFISNCHLILLFVFIFKELKNLLKINFNSSYPSLLLFDFYRLGYLCSLKAKK